MTHMQAAGHVWWRDHDAIRLTGAGWSEIIAVFPVLVDRSLDRMRVVYAI